MLSFSILYYSTKSRIHRPKIKIKFLFIFICSLIFCSIRILNNNFGSGQRFLIRADPDPQHWPEKHVPYFPNLQRSSWNFNPRCYCCSPGWPGEPVEPVLRELLWPGLCTTAGQQRRATPLQVRCPNFTTREYCSCVKCPTVLQDKTVVVSFAPTVPKDNTVAVSGAPTVRKYNTVVVAGAPTVRQKKNTLCVRCPNCTAR